MGLLRKCISQDKKVVFSVVDATDAVAESLERLSAFPPSMVHLGQSMMAATLLQSLWNDKGQVRRVTLQWKVDGPFGHLFADANEKGHVRGTILSPQAPVDNYETGLGQGTLQVQKFTQSESTGIVEANGHVSTDILEYLAQSEQRDCTMALSVKIGWASDKKDKFVVEHALGYLIDILPMDQLDEKKKVLQQWDNYLSSLGPISEWSLPKEDKVDAMFQLLNVQTPLKDLIFQRINFHCDCNEERAERAARLSEKMAPEETKDGPLTVQCEFCGKIYHLK